MFREERNVALTSYLGEIAWRTGELVHRDVPRWRKQSSTDAEVVSIRRERRNFGRIISRRSHYPSYPYWETPTEPLSPSPLQTGPVLTGADVDDFGDADYVADPFLWPDESGHWHLFFEIYNGDRDPDAVIGHATTGDLVHFEYDQVVLETDVHLSFPYIFKYNGEMYMLPEREPNKREQSVVLYRAANFPTDWSEAASLVSPSHPNDDSVLFRWDGVWWLIVGDADQHALHVYYSESLEATDWTPHEANPVVCDRPTAARPGGRPIVRDDHVIVFYQDCDRTYGQKLRAFRITELDSTTYRDEEVSSSPVLKPGQSLIGWNSGNMHHMDPWWTGRRWICAVDGNITGKTLLTEDHWSIGMYVSD